MRILDLLGLGGGMSKNSLANAQTHKIYIENSTQTLAADL